MEVECVFLGGKTEAVQLYLQASHVTGCRDEGRGGCGCGLLGHGQ